MQDVITRIDQLLELVRAQNELLNAQNSLLRTFVEAMTREEEQGIQLEHLREILGGLPQAGGAPNISVMDRDDDAPG